MDPIEALLSGAAAFRQEHGRPLVTLSYAQSLDGSITTRRGEQLALSGPQSKQMTHELRAAHAVAYGAILVGVGTVLADDPRLTARLAGGPHPQPVVLDTQLKTPLNARLLRSELPPWIACGGSADPALRLALEAAGAQVIILPPGGSGGVSLAALLAELARRGIDCLMVEGGARVIAAFLAAQLVDQAVITIAPRFVGGLPAVGAGALAGCMPRLASPQSQPYGDDLVIWGKLDYS